MTPDTMKFATACKRKKQGNKPFEGDHTENRDQKTMKEHPETSIKIYETYSIKALYCKPRDITERKDTFVNRGLMYFATASLNLSSCRKSNGIL